MPKQHHRPRERDLCQRGFGVGDSDEIPDRQVPQAAELALDVSGALASQGFIELPMTVLHGQTTGCLPGPHGDPFDRMLIALSDAGRSRFRLKRSRLRPLRCTTPLVKVPAKPRIVRLNSGAQGWSWRPGKVDCARSLGSGPSGKGAHEPTLPRCRLRFSQQVGKSNALTRRR
jgi:hypothetical protein